MKNFLILFLILGLVQSGITQNSDPGFEVKCGHSKTTNVTLGTVVYCANGSGHNTGPIAVKHKIERLTSAFFKKFPIFAKALFKCDNQDCPNVQCIKSVKVYSARGTDPRFVSGEYHGEGKWSSIIRLKIKATCSDCDDGKPINDGGGGPGSGEVDVECGGEQGYAYPFFKHNLEAEDEDAAQQEAEKAQELLEEMLEYFPELIDVKVNCIGECDENEECVGSFEFEGTEIQGPSQGEEGYCVQFIVRGTAKCTVCQKGDHEGEIIKRDGSDEIDLVLYPNPARDHIHVDVNAASKQEQLVLEIVDVQGKRFLNQLITPDIQSYRLDISGIQPGLYFLHLKDEKGLIAQQSFFIE